MRKLASLPTIVLAAGMLATPLALAGCSMSASVTPTVSASKVASTAEDALEKSVGRRPSIDCGSEAIELKQGKVVDCELTDPQTNTKYDTKVTLTKVDGKKFTVKAVVANQPED